MFPEQFNDLRVFYEKLLKIMDDSDHIYDIHIMVRNELSQYTMDKQIKHLENIACIEKDQYNFIKDKHLRSIIVDIKKTVQKGFIKSWQEGVIRKMKPHKVAFLFKRAIHVSGKNQDERALRNLEYMVNMNYKNSASKSYYYQMIEAYLSDLSDSLQTISLDGDGDEKYLPYRYPPIKDDVIVIKEMHDDMFEYKQLSNASNDSRSSSVHSVNMTFFHPLPFNHHDQNSDYSKLNDQHNAQSPLIENNQTPDDCKCCCIIL